LLPAIRLPSYWTENILELKYADAINLPKERVIKVSCKHEPAIPFGNFMGR
jgi:hypothetical protein